MKKVICNEELKCKINEAVLLLCPIVKSTLGPCGKNVIIDHSSFTPFITNDGVTIAENIESDDVCVNTILSFIKEASIKTNETVGDGTTTTIVLLESIYKESLKYINNGLSPIVLKNQFEEALNTIEKEINIISKLPNNNDLLNIAINSSNSSEIGKIISEVYLKVKNKDAIEIITTENENTSIEYKQGYIIDTNLASNYYFKDTNEIKIKDCNVLLLEDELNDLENISQILNYIIVNKQNLAIIADNYSDEVINDIMNLYLNENIYVYLIKNPEYGLNKYKLIKDIESICNCKTNTSIGIVDNLFITKDNIIFKYKKNNNTNKRINEIYLEDDDDFKNKRISMLKNGLATIKVGGKTTTEAREKKMRFDDALCAIDQASKGICIGEGLTFLKVSDNIKDNNEALKIIKKCLKTPFIQIMDNAFLDSKKILDKIIDNDYKLLFNISKNEYENINNTSIIDPTSVIINSLKNACSIACMLLSTNSLVINEYVNSINKIDDFNI